MAPLAASLGATSVPFILALNPALKKIDPLPLGDDSHLSGSYIADIIRLSTVVLFRLNWLPFA